MDPSENEAVFTLFSRLIDLDALKENHQLVYRTTDGNYELFVQLLSDISNAMIISLTWENKTTRAGARAENAINISLDTQSKKISIIPQKCIDDGKQAVCRNICDTNLGAWLSITALRRYRPGDNTGDGR